MTALRGTFAREAHAPLPRGGHSFACNPVRLTQRRAYGGDEFALRAPGKPAKSPRQQVADTQSAIASKSTNEVSTASV